jgi:pyrroline-5-carboxylate reductase
MMSGAKQTLLVVGCGNMGSAIAIGASRRGDLQVIGLDPDIERAAKLLSPCPDVALIADVAELGETKPACVVLATKPALVASTLMTASGRFTHALVISIAAGVTLSVISSALPSNKRLVRAMPNLPAQVGAGMTVAYADPNSLSPADRTETAVLFEALGRFLWLDSEGLVDAATAISGSGPGFVFAFAEYLAKGGEAVGLAPAVAAELARQTIIGAGRLMAADDRTPSELKAAVASPGGTTQAGLAVLEADNGLPACMLAATSAAAKRANELSYAPAQQQ